MTNWLRCLWLVSVVWLPLLSGVHRVRSQDTQAEACTIVVGAPNRLISYNVAANTISVIAERSLLPLGWSSDNTQLVAVDFYELGADISALTPATTDAPQRLATAVSSRAVTPVSPDGRTLAYVPFAEATAGEPPYSLVQHNLADSSEREVAQLPFAPYTMHWSPDGQFLVIEGRETSGADRVNTLFIVEVATGDIEALPVTIRSAGGIRPLPQWSPDGAYIAVQQQAANGDASILITAVEGEAVLTIPNAANPSWSPEGRRLTFEALDDGHRRVVTAALDALNTTTVVSDEGEAAMLPTWAPYPEAIAYLALSVEATDQAGQDSELLLVVRDLTTGEVNRAALGSASAYGLYWSPSCVND